MSFAITGNYSPNLFSAAIGWAGGLGAGVTFMYTNTKMIETKNLKDLPGNIKKLVNKFLQKCQE